MKTVMLYFLVMVLGGMLACQTNSSAKAIAKKSNSLVSLWLPFAPERVRQVYNHSLVRSPRFSSDCLYDCPDMDIWRYQYQDPKTKTIITSDKPIAIKKEYWRAADEARILAISLFDSKELYYNALLDYLDSFASIKKMNGITDETWGYETFTVRVYVSGRNPRDVARLGKIENATSDAIVNHLLERGCEIAFVDNKQPLAKKDGTFWRFAAASDEMPEGQRVRYLFRDADNILTAVEMYTVADWIKSDKRYHRMHIIPTCFGPLTAMLWGGTHTGAGDFADYREMLHYYPYRYQYGDDEMFTRDLIWPRIKAIGSVLTHHFPRGDYKDIFGTPYRFSCEEPTKDFCRAANPASTCEDRELPELENFEGAVEALGLRVPLKELVDNQPEYFDLDLKNPARRFVYDAFKSK